ncbi:hypothetical protein KAR91_49580 [Candidatus Pacearchaeota archaeon]|nr:hypothetical protein [Candidatus Pacearchaeota archaeon]
MSTFKRIIDENIRKNLKKIVALFGDALLTAFAVVLFAMKAELDIVSTIMFALFAFKPYVTHYVNLVFKGEAGEAILENNILRQELGYQRELSGWELKVAAMNNSAPNAVKANKDWNDANSAIKDIENLEAK